MILTDVQIADQPGINPLLDARGNEIVQIHHIVKMEIYFETDQEFQLFQSRVSLQTGAILNASSFGDSPAEKRKDVVIKQLEQELKDKKEEIKWLSQQTGKKIRKPLLDDEITNLTYVQV